MKGYKLISILLFLSLLLASFTSAAASAPLSQAAATPTPPPPYKLTILHTNDIHASYDPNAAGDGGAARAATVIQTVRTEAPNNLLLNAGDNFTGSLYYVQHRGQDAVTIMNTLRYDAMTLGNHEFDDGAANLSAFIKQVRFPVVSANMEFEKTSLLASKVLPYTILQKGGQKIGVIGLITPEVTILAKLGEKINVQSDLAAVAQKYIDELTGKGVNKIILLTHIGYKTDQELAQKLKGVDIVVGGHSHTFLNNRFANATAPYPAALKNADGEPVLVVQSGEKFEFIGRLDVEFNEKGVLTKWGGDTIHLSHYVTPDRRVTQLLASLFAPIKKLKLQKVGETAVLLQGDRKVCRFEECNLGNLITDAMRKETGAQIAIENGGGIRASIDVGPITMGEVLEVLPFNNLVSTLELTGADVLVALENGVSRVDAEEGTGRFPQVSGIKFTFDASKPVGSRIVSAEVFDEASNSYKPLDPQATYKIATNDYMRTGGDDYKVFAEKAINPYDYGRPLDQVLADYIKANSPIKIEVEGRITAVKK